MFTDEFDLLISTIIAMATVLISMICLAIIRKNSNKEYSESEKIIYELKEIANNSATNVSFKELKKGKYDSKLDELIKIYHEQALTQAKIQFWFSLIAAIIGFVVIICIFLFTQSTVWYEHIIRILPGGIIEAVSVLFFTQSRETRERGSDFLNRLRADRQYEKSISIVETITDETLRNKLKGEIALHLCDIKNFDLNPTVLKNTTSQGHDD